MVFSSVMDVRGFLEKHSVKSCATYWDFFSIVNVMGFTADSGQQQSNRIYSAHRAKMHSALEADLLATMRHERPEILFGKSVDGGSGNNAVMFGKCKTQVEPSSLPDRLSAETL
jgi:hypothetical protein